MAGRQRVAEKLVVQVGLFAVEGVDEGVQLIGVSLADGFGEPYVELGEGDEHAKAPYSAQKIEQQVPHGSAFGCHISAHGGQDRGYGGAYVAAQHQGACQLEGYPAFAAHNQHDGKSGRRTLYDGCYHQSDGGEQQYAAEIRCGVVLKKRENLGIALEVRHIVAYHVQSHEQEAEAYEEFAEALGLAFIDEQ